jgi:hypothetical protein
VWLSAIGPPTKKDRQGGRRRQGRSLSGFASNASRGASNKIDYILLSPELFAHTKAGGIFRMGVWGGKNGTLFPHYPEM